jgi:molybdopterin synthase catalytic subunit
MIEIRISRDVIDPQEIIALVANESCGATSLFLGTVRDQNDGRAVTGIDYSAYELMAERETRRIVEEAATTFGVERTCVVHRIGKLGLGDVSVAIAVAHARRGPAMDATRYIIEELKKRVPVWKREHYADGTRDWVGASGQTAPVPK